MCVVPDWIVYGRKVEEGHRKSPSHCYSPHLGKDVSNCLT